MKKQNDLVTQYQLKNKVDVHVAAAKKLFSIQTLCKDDFFAAPRVFKGEKHQKT